MPELQLEKGLAALGSLCWRRPWLVVLIWLMATIAAGFATSKMADRLLSGSGDITGSSSQRVDAQLSSQFGGGDGQSLILVYRSQKLDAESAQFSKLEDDLTEKLSSQSHVQRVIRGEDIFGDQVVPRPGTGHFLLISLDSPNSLTTEQQTPFLRAAAQSVFDAFAQDFPELEWAITGRSALTYDINIFSTEDTVNSEIRAMPFALIILVFAFGAVFSALLPMVLALAARTLALATVLIFAGVWEIANLAQSIVTMLSLALGIDYSLFLVHRYRQLLNSDVASSENKQGERSSEAVMCAAMAQSGRVILYSGIAVAIGMGALLATPLMQTRSIGIGGLCAVFMSVLAALTLLPAILSLLGTRLLDWAPGLGAKKRQERSRQLWTKWGQWIVARPIAAIGFSLIILFVMSAPAGKTKFGFPEEDFLPPELESARGVSMLEDMGLKGLVSPLFVIVSDPGGESIVIPERIRNVSRLAARLRSDERIELVITPNFVAATRDLPFPVPANRNSISQNKDRILLKILPSADTTLSGLRDLAAEIPDWMEDEALDVEVGGQAQYYNDYDEKVRNSFPIIVGLVLGMTGVALFLLLGAPLASAKAILLNLCSVAAGYGVVVFVFQLGYGASFFGLTGPTELVPTTVPIVIFSILFGLSMDYEIFLISRIKSLYLQTGSNKQSIVEALVDTGSVITNAALIMAVVFGAFAFSRILIVQMIGLGLATAIIVDAVLIRSVFGPALMRLAGRWNWWPLRSSTLTYE